MTAPIARTCRLTTIALALAFSAHVHASRAEAQAWHPAPGHLQLPIWPRGVPDSQPARAPESAITPSTNVVAGRQWTSVRDVSVPTITRYSPNAKLNTHAAVLVFPGGGYQILAIDLEGTEVCDWLVSRGITCVLLKYRVPSSGPHWDAKCRCHVTPHPLTALQDAQRAIGLVRAHAAEWRIDPHKVGVLGFSAGGHLVAAISNDWRKRIYGRVDAADDQSARPDFAIGVYPGHLWESDTAHSPIAFNPDIHVTRQTPPTFLVQAETDSIDNVNQSLAYYVALRNAGVPVEMHLYVNGGHAFGLRRTRDPITEWPLLVERWLQTIGVIDTVDRARTTTTSSSPAAGGPDTTRAHRLPGCYRLSLGPWSSPSDLRPPAPTEVFRLDSTTVRSATPGARTAARLLPAELMPPTDPRTQWLQPASWRLVGSDSLEVVTWSTATEAETFYGHTAGTGLRGVLRRTTDLIPMNRQTRQIMWDVWPWAQASARRVSCP
jgi:acetyl esterase/lipase